MRDLTPIEFRRLEKSLDILENPAEQIAYQHTVFCQTSMPYKDPRDARVWERQQGAIFLRIEAGAVRKPGDKRYIEVGLPYGSRPRLIMAYLNAAALRNRSARIDVDGSFTAFVKRILPERGINSREICRFKTQLTRFAACSVRMSVDLPETRAYQINTQIIDAMELWLSKDERQRVLWPAYVELSPRYYESLAKHAVPLDERAIAALSNSPMALDVYAWLAQRLCRIPRNKPQFISWVSLKDQFGQEFRRMDHFKEHFHIVAGQVYGQYRAAKFELDGRGMTLAGCPPPVPARLVRL